MSEKESVRWLCHRCVTKEGATVDPDPVVIRDCDGCHIENYTRPESGVVEIVEVLKEAPLEEDGSAEILEEENTSSIEKTSSDKEKEIEALKAKLAELEK